MSAHAGDPTKPRTTPIALWVSAAVTVLIVAFVLWLGWPKKPTVLPAGQTAVQVYFIDDHPALTTPAASGEEDRWFGRIALPCGVTMWYVESEGAAVCASLDGPKGTVTVTSEGGRISLDAAAQKRLVDWRTADGDWEPPTRALLLHDEEPVGIVTIDDAGTAVPAH